MLPKFDLVEHIKNYNQDNKTKYSLDADFGFDYFDQAFLSDIRSTIDYIYHGTDDNYFTAEEKEYQQWGRDQYMDALKRFVKNEIAEKPQKPACEDAVSNKIFYRNWIIAKQAELNDAENWKKWSVNARNLETIQATWGRQCEFAHHTHAALLEAIDLLDTLERHYRAAKKALESFWLKRHIPTPIYDAYEKHIADFFAAASVARQQMLESMRGRLEAWDKGEPSVIAHTVKKVVARIKASGATVSPSATEPPLFTETLTPAQFSAFHQRIEQHGTADLKRRMQHLSWRHAKTEQAAIPLTTITQETGSVMVPTALVKDIPKKPPVPLFKGVRLRHAFFNDKGHLLASLNKPIAMDALVLDVNDPNCMDKTLAKIHDQEAMIEDALRASNSILKKLSTVFQDKSVQFIKTWQGLLQEHRLTQITCKLQLADKLLVMLEQQDRYAVVQQSHHCVHLQALLVEIKSNLTSLDHRAFNGQLDTIQHRAAKFLACHRAYDTVVQLSAGHLLSVNALYYMAEYVEALQITGSAEPFLTLCEPHLKKIAAAAKNLLQQSTFNEHQNAFILQSDVVLDRLGSSGQKRRWQHQRIKFFHRYLAAKKDELKQGTQGNSSVDHAENLLLHIGKGIAYPTDDATVADLVQEIRDSKSVTQKEKLIARCLAQSINIKNEMLVGRFNKDLTVFHYNIQQRLASCEYSYSPDDINRILGICERAVEEDKGLDVIVQDKFDRTLLGLNNPKDTTIRPLLEAHIMAERAHRQISKKASLQQNKENLQKLQAHLLSQPNNTSFGELLKSRSGKRILFLQTKIDTEVDQPEPEQEARSMHY